MSVPKSLTCGKVPAVAVCSQNPQISFMVQTWTNEWWQESKSPEFSFWFMFNGIGSEPITVCMRDRRADRWGQAGGSRERVADGIVTCRQSRKWRGGGMLWGKEEQTFVEARESKVERVEMGFRTDLCQKDVQDGSETCYDVWFRGDRSWKCVTGSKL